MWKSGLLSGKLILSNYNITHQQSVFFFTKSAKVSPCHQGHFADQNYIAIIDSSSRVHFLCTRTFSYWIYISKQFVAFRWKLWKTFQIAFSYDSLLLNSLTEQLVDSTYKINRKQNKKIQMINQKTITEKFKHSLCIRWPCEIVTFLLMIQDTHNICTFDNDYDLCYI